ncbi:nucleolar MIF4G domain-containing protein 1 homolog [Anopheles marshallii]|uniref:nucleolar MIF4G domain-containing protein 1 homolog n=1 Tax=Anopheles marshallii TaxID=1521116 RepID=UPI00237ACF0E|nr:nucleolar MIF4G domain-containing protein 1 homolog [Anopheles marshallii]
MKVRRPPKNVRQGKAGRNGRNSKVIPQIKTRKDLRKEKRQQKKLNRFNYHNRSRKEQNAADNRTETGKKRDKYGEGNSEDESEDFEDEEIPSDFSDEEKETKPSAQKPPAKTKNAFTSQLDVEREKEMKELRRYEDGLKSNRIKQLEAANEEDDRIIQKYEKLLKINRRKNKEGVPKSFNDGLDYALELCTDDSIRKMYDAAKEAAELEENSEDEFVEDLKQAVGVDRTEEPKSDEKSSRTTKKRKKLSAKEKNRVVKLKKIEEKYFGLDEMDDLGEFDSEIEVELDDNADDDYSENDELYESDEENIGQEKNAKRVQFASDERVEKNGKKRSNSESDSDDEYDDFDNEDDEYDDEESAEGSFEDEEPSSSSMPVGKKEKSKSRKQSKNEEENDESPGRFVLLKANKDKQSKNGQGSREKVIKKASKHNPTSDSEEEQDFDEDEDEFDEDEDEFDEEHDGLDDLFEDGSDSDEIPDGEKKPPSNDDGTWEDIYGRKRDKAGNVIKEESTSVSGGKYVPPHIRAKLEAEQIAKGKAADPKQQERLQRLKRQLKGQINRLAESNVHRISITLDSLYMQNSRYDMNSTLTTLILEATVVPTLTPERMVLEHMLLVAILHANVGSEVGSHFLETIVERFLELLKQIDTIANEAKQLDNCVQIMCHLYTFDIVKCKMVHEMMQKLIDCFNEKAVECILLVLRSVGFMLRKDDPLALKDLIIAIQKKAANAPDELKNDTRVKFMLETLLAVKNNNMNKIPQYDPTLVEHFRKLLKGMITSGKYVSTLNIGIEDIINIPERGKWWLVGSAWLGNKENPSAAGTGGNAPGAEGQYSAQLLELARQQRMNTDDRRNVFCIVMSAEDYLDAFEKLIRLAIKDLRIVVSVIIHCSLAEKEYNPYYGVLSQKFCDFDRRYQLAIQYALWDRLKEIHALQQQQVRNLARFITHLIAEGGLALSCLKVIEFAEIDKVNLRLMRQIMLGLLLQENENKCLQVFSRISASNKLKSFKDGIRLFMHHFLARGSMSYRELADEQVQLLQQRIKQADELLSTDTRIEYDV